MNVQKENVVTLFEELGVTAAAKWNVKRMEAKLAKIGEMVDDDVVLTEDSKKLLDNIINAEANGEPITITTDATPAAEAAPAKGKAKATPAPDKAADKAAEKAAAKLQKDADKKAAEEKKAADKAAAKAAKDAAKAAAAPGIPGVRETRTRPYLAGTLIAKYGPAAGVTEEMVAELDDLYGKVNPVESLFTLRNAWHAVRGFTEKK